MNPPLKVVPKLTTKPQRQTRTTLDTILFTRDQISGWKIPPFQRPLRINEKVRDLSNKIKEDGGVIPGVLTIGIIDKEKFLLDGQHRREAFLMSELPEGYADVRMHFFDDMAEMGEEFVNLNSQLVRLKPDDILRGLEGVNSALGKIRKKCPFVGYDMIRRSERSPIVSMSSLLRCWFGSATEVPATSGGMTASELARAITEEEADNLIVFVNVAYEAWGRDEEYARLWGNLNLAICMWLYRRMVITPWSPRTPKLTREMFGKCLMALSANEQYLDWLVGRQLRDRDRSPAYGRMKQLFARRLEDEMGRKVALPQPPWASHSSRANR